MRPSYLSRGRDSCLLSSFHLGRDTFLLPPRKRLMSTFLLPPCSTDHHPAGLYKAKISFVKPSISGILMNIDILDETIHQYPRRNNRSHQLDMSQCNIPFQSHQSNRRHHPATFAALYHNRSPPLRPTIHIHRSTLERIAPQ